MSTPYTFELSRIRALLQRRPITAKAIAQHLGCCKATVYRQIRELKREGAKLEHARVRDSATGPKARTYFIPL